MIITWLLVFIIAFITGYKVRQMFDGGQKTVIVKMNAEEMLDAYESIISVEKLKKELYKNGYL
jgi:hypothetical protein